MVAKTCEIRALLEPHGVLGNYANVLTKIRGGAYDSLSAYENALAGTFSTPVDLSGDLFSKKDFEDALWKVRNVWEGNTADALGWDDLEDQQRGKLTEALWEFQTFVSSESTAENFQSELDKFLEAIHPNNEQKQNDVKELLANLHLEDSEGGDLYYWDEYKELLGSPSTDFIFTNVHREALVAMANDIYSLAMGTESELVSEANRPFFMNSTFFELENDERRLTALRNAMPKKFDSEADSLHFALASIDHDEGDSALVSDPFTGESDWEVRDNGLVSVNDLSAVFNANCTA